MLEILRISSKVLKWRSRHLGHSNSEKKKIGVTMSCVIGNTFRNKKRKGAVAKIFKISSKRHIPMGLLNAAEESFSCTICKVCPPKPPLICCRSCSSIVGCESCVNRWYGSGQAALTKTCPKCRQERGFANTFELKGVSPFLQELDKLINDEIEHDGSLDATIPN